MAAFLRRPVPSLLLLLLPVPFAACGGEEPAARGRSAAPARAPAEFVATVRELAPSDAHVLIGFASADRARELVARVGEAFGQGAPPDPLATMAGQSGLDVSAVDRTRPWAVALTLSKEAPLPRQTFILPYADPAKAAASHEGPADTGNGYAALSTAGGTVTGGLALADGLRAGDVALRIDLARLFAMYREEIEEGLGAFDRLMGLGVEGQDTPTAVAESMRASFAWYVDAARDVVTSADTLDVAVTRADDGRLELDGVLTAREGSALDRSGMEPGNLPALARHVPADLPLAVHLRFDWRGYMDTLAPFFDAWVGNLPEEDREGFRDYVARATAMLHELGDESSIGIGGGPQGLRMVMALRAADPEAYVERYVALLGEPALKSLGMGFEDLGTRTVAGATSHRIRMRLDVQTYLATLGMEGRAGVPSGADMARTMDMLAGEDGWVFDMIARDDLVLFALDPTGELIGAALAGADGGAASRPELARAAGDLRFAMRLDVRKAALELAALMARAGEEVPEIAAGPPLPIVVALSGDGPVHRWGLTLDLEALVRFAKSLEVRPAPR